MIINNKKIVNNLNLLYKSRLVSILSMRNKKSKSTIKATADADFEKLNNIPVKITQTLIYFAVYK